MRTTLAGVLSVKQDTHNLNVTLEKARNMEQRVREKALSAQAELEARGKIVLAEAMAQRDAEAVLRIHNETYLAEVAHLDIMRTGRLEQMAEIEGILKAHKDLSEGEKHRVAEYLNGKEGFAVLDACAPIPNSAIAVGLVRSGTRDFDGATQGMPDYAKDGVRRLIEDAREWESGRGRDRGHRRGRGPELSL